MKFHFILFVVGILFITAGYAKQMKPSCQKGVEVRFVPRTVYDEISQGKAFTESDYETDMDGNYSLGMFGSSYQERLDDFIDRLNPNEEGDPEETTEPELSNVVA